MASSSYRTMFKNMLYCCLFLAPKILSKFTRNMEINKIWNKMMQMLSVFSSVIISEEYTVKRLLHRVIFSAFCRKCPTRLAKTLQNWADRAFRAVNSWNKTANRHIIWCSQHSECSRTSSDSACAHGSLSAPLSPPSPGSHGAADRLAQLSMLPYSHGSAWGRVAFRGKAPFFSSQTPFYKSEVCPLHPTC